MNKTLLFEQILTELKSVHQSAFDAALRAYETATDKENEAENKYDTLGLEASYLAHGQSKRLAECEADIMAFKKLEASTFSTDTPIKIGAYVSLEDEDGHEKNLFISPVSGGLRINFCNIEVTLVTPSAPLGKALIHCIEGDEIKVTIAGEIMYYQIMKVY